MFSIIAPIDTNRLKQFHQTKLVYDSFPEKKQFILPTRSYDKVKQYLERNDLMKDVMLMAYDHETGFNPSKALNLGVMAAKYDNIIITSPEVKPLTDVLKQLSECLDQNVLCQVHDQDENGNLSVLVCENYRSDTPAMYFLAKFKRSDIEAINGWDEDFMKGYAYEDNDFGERWNRAGLPFIMRDDIQAVHQWHPRSETIRGGAVINQQHYHDNTDQGVVKPPNGLYKI